jgi:hypothetical protein
VKLRAPVDAQSLIRKLGLRERRRPAIRDRQEQRV